YGDAPAWLLMRRATLRAAAARWATRLPASVLGDGLLQAEVFGAVEQLVQLAFLHAIDLVARAFDLGAAHFIAGFLGLGLGFGCRLPGSLGELGAVLEAVGECRCCRKQRHRQHRRTLDRRFHEFSPRDIGSELPDARAIASG